ncbi:RNA 2'-phosphotransferase [Comamonas terrigena]|uniref:RNA 2'-phosphotransferase n=1 Tax=Comamonas terrigena TaxID=32013 RepID=UPI003132AD04
MALHPGSWSPFAALACSLHVHLSTDAQTAETVGRRHGKPCVLWVDAQAMHASGQVFWRAENGVWLTTAVAPEFIGFPSDAV